jgi:hypothetical protein
VWSDGFDINIKDLVSYRETVYNVEKEITRLFASKGSVMWLNTDGDLLINGTEVTTIASQVQDILIDKNGNNIGYFKSNNIWTPIKWDKTLGPPLEEGKHPYINFAGGDTKLFYDKTLKRLYQREEEGEGIFVDKDITLDFLEGTPDYEYLENKTLDNLIIDGNYIWYEVDSHIFVKDASEYVITVTWPAHLIDAAFNSNSGYGIILQGPNSTDLVSIVPDSKINYPVGSYFTYFERVIDYLMLK